MLKDCFGLAMTAASREAVDHYSKSLCAFLGYRRDTGVHLKSALGVDSELFMGHCLRGYFFKLFALPALEHKARESAKKAREFARTASAREREHLDALEAWCAGNMLECTERWERILIDHPRDAIALRLAHHCHFYMGQSFAMRTSIARVLPYWPADEAGGGFVRGMYAFALEESGNYSAALDVGEEAVTLNPRDAWAVHAVAHVHEMQGQSRDGIAWLERTEEGWSDCNNFAYHVWWHKALFYFEIAEHNEALQLYDKRFRVDQSEDYLDISNAVAMLWRLENSGFDVGPRWVELADKAEARTSDHLLAFADLHFAIALGAVKRHAALDEMIESMGANYTGKCNTQEQVLFQVSAKLTMAIRAYYLGEYDFALRILRPLMNRLHFVGGSHAQRDLFAQLQIAAALKSKQYSFARALLHERTNLRPNDAQSWHLLAEALGGEGRDGEADNARRRAETLLSE